MESTIRELLSDLVRVETENPPGNEAACSERIVEWFGEREIDAKLVPDPYEERPQAVATVGEGEPTLVLNGHVDVVPAGDRSQWSHDPYGAEIDGDRLYGRGAVDMKAGVAAGMVATARLAEEIRSGALGGSIVFQAAIGEETAEPGTKRLLELGYGGEYGVVLEPTGLRTATSEKGLAWYEITVEGDPSHASRPDRGSNAIRNAQPVLDALDRYDRRVREREDDLVGRAYATVTEFDAGTKENVVPERASITLDRRFLPTESAETVDREIDDLLSGLERAYGIETDWRRTRTYESAEIPVDSPLAETVRERSREVAGVDDEPWGIQASTDVRNFVNDAGIEAVTWGPGDIDEAHTYDESVDLTEVETAVEVLEAVGRDLLGERGE
ncbi:M20 family metallopeptidase [Natronorarus salvus]|uniref:M20 family metallopeptidase n=1 Tax=Natronorarus salvus TaxID=3117733 RepID=UPI003908105B